MKLNQILLVVVVIAIILIVILFSSYQVEEVKNDVSSQEDRAMSAFLEDVLLSDYSNMKMWKKLMYDDVANGPENLYGSIWYENNVKFYVALHYNDNNMLGIADLYILIDAEIPDELNEENASLLLNKYFKNVSSGEIECGSDSSVSWCEKFWTNQDGDKMGMFILNSPNNKVVGACMYPIGSNNYELSTCIQAL